MEEVVETAKNSDFTHDDSNDVMILSNENDHDFVLSKIVYFAMEKSSSAIHISVHIDAPTNPIQLKTLLQKRLVAQMWQRTTLRYQKI
ncbi:hypothetical protein RhiirA4_412904 [Rhizophagus irregularis]|uniref:Uncharacterized protein n=1 Tax=Rhizophagus irregularis TaxID=588596 RepID=A0A2I1HQT4_9GLOM|nr:hypothetical protein RhiirA4_412904 [Rhizophagus irregularis]